MKKVVYFVCIALFLFIINNFFHSIYRLWQKQDLIVTAQKELLEQQQEKKQLQIELERIQNTAYIEEEARNKLFLVKPGEKIVVIPKEATEQKKTIIATKPPEPAWLQWYNLVK